MIKGEALGLRVDNMPIVEEFQDVFSNELLRLVFEEEVKFSMDLASSTTLISKERKHRHLLKMEQALRLQLNIALQH